MKKGNIIVLLGIILFVIVIAIMYIFGGSKSNTKDKIQEDKNKKFSQIEYNIPNEFEKSDSKYMEKYSYNDNNAYCYFTIRSYDKKAYSGFDEWFKSKINFDLTYEVSELKTININDSEVYNIELFKDKTRTYYYGFSSTDYYYLVDFEIRDYIRGDRNDVDSNLCFNIKDDIILSIKVK